HEGAPGGRQLRGLSDPVRDRREGRGGPGATLVGRAPPASPPHRAPGLVATTPTEHLEWWPPPPPSTWNGGHHPHRAPGMVATTRTEHLGWWRSRREDT